MTVPVAAMNKNGPATRTVDNIRGTRKIASMKSVSKAQTSQLLTYASFGWCIGAFYTAHQLRTALAGLKFWATHDSRPSREFRTSSRQRPVGYLEPLDPLEPRLSRGERQERSEHF